MHIDLEKFKLSLNFLNKNLIVCAYGLDTNPQ